MTFVSVPNVDGVPAVNFAIGFGDGIDLLSSDGAQIPSQLSPSPWGIYLGGAPVIVANSTISFEFRKEWLLLDYPVERGGFETYNKVWTPYIGRVRFASGGDYAAREALLASIDAIAGDTNIYSLVTPEAIYPSCNVAHYNYDRSATRGAGMIVIDVWMQEIQQLGSVSSNTASPSSAAQQNNGTVQPQTPSTAQVQDLNVADVAAAGGIP